jgi:Uncharacterised protein conserved in bacteria (DUF2336)
LHPEFKEVIQELLPDKMRLITNQAQRQPNDYRAAEIVVKSPRLTEEIVNEFAKEKKLPEMTVSIAQLSSLSVDEIERCFMGKWTSPVAIILKAIGFHLSTIDTIYRARLSGEEIIRSDLIQIKAEFLAVRRATAERILRFFYAKRAAKISNLAQERSVAAQVR